MGKFLNGIREQNQFLLATREKNFVDKSEMIAKLNDIVSTLERFVCITKPRRFGKSINACMLASYYSKTLDMKEVFDNLKIAKFPSYGDHLNKHNIIYISFNVRAEEFKTYDEYINYFKEGLKEDLKEFCPEVPNGMFVVDMIEYVYDKTKEGFIFIIDEWDYIFNNEMYDKKDRENFLRFLKSLLKDKAYVKLAYMTGILPIAKYSSGSSLNMFMEYDTISDELYSEYFGFLEEEVENLCAKQSIITMDELREWYNGYCNEDGIRIYNPRSVVYALKNGKCKSYWTTTGRKKEIEYWINVDVRGVRKDIINMLAGNSIEMMLLGYDAESKDLVNSRNMVLSAMTILGFLSYYDNKVRIPNRELMMEFRQLVATSEKDAFREIVKNSEDVLQATLDQNEEKLAELIEDTHNTYNSYFEYGTENALSCVVAVAYLAARNKYTIKREDVLAKGRADFAFYPNKTTNTAFIIELKKDDTPEGAISQIKEREYFIPFKNFKGKKLLVGIGYDTKTKKHTVKIEAMKED